MILSYRRYGKNGKTRLGSCRTENKLQQAVVLPARILLSSTACGGKVVQQIGTSVHFSGAVKTYLVMVLMICLTDRYEQRDIDANRLVVQQACSSPHRARLARRRRRRCPVTDE